LTSGDSNLCRFNLFVRYRRCKKSCY